MPRIKVVIFLFFTVFFTSRLQSQIISPVIKEGNITVSSVSRTSAAPLPDSLMAPFKRGVNFSHWFENVSHFSQVNFNLYSREDFENIKSLGCDHVRVPVEFFEMTGPAPDFIIHPLLFNFLDRAVDWAEELGLYLIIDNHGFENDFEMGEAYLDQLLAVWAQVAGHYADRSALICYEILNEPHGLTADQWNELQQQTIDTIRSIDRYHTIIVGPVNYNNYNDLDLMQNFIDTNLIYTFHFYDPLLFTHQGAGWMFPGMEDLSGVPFPYVEDQMPDLPPELTGTWIETNYNNYPSEGNDAWIQSKIAVAVDFRDSRKVPVWCGEFGVYKHGSPAEDRIRWLEVVRSGFEANSISWTLREYGNDFGIYKEDRELFDYDVNLQVINALGLSLPSQLEYRQIPDSTGLIIYDDFLPYGILHNDWAPNSILNYCSEDNPVEGDYNISWSESDLYGTIGFRFSAVRDFSQLRSGNFLLDFWIRCSDPDLKLNIRFVDTDTGDPDDHPWRMGYVIDNSLVPFDGTWQHIKIPLRNLAEQGSWDDEIWFDPQGLFDWSQIELMEIGTDYQNMQGITLSLDYIRIVAPTPSQDSYQNPVVPGFHPDPSICRAGDDYYLVTSTFEYFPGVPIFHSRDLVHWRQIGNCLTRKSQLNLDNAVISGGIYAPTIRYHDGTFYMITSNFNYGGNFYVTATNPEGPWSEPVWLDDWHMDPSLLFDDDGTVYMTYQEGGEQGHIAQRVLDINTGQLQGTAATVWNGTGNLWPEGPHLYKINGNYYLMIAEGGTSYNHRETIARSSSPWGPFTEYSDNPILTHSDRPGHPIQALGHADLIETSDEWWMVCLGIRPKGGYYHHLGRETFLAPVSWNTDGWPEINITGTLELEMNIVPGLPQYEWPPEPERYEFNSPILSYQWNFVRNPFDGDWSLTERPGFLRLNGSAVTLNDQSSPAFAGIRQTAFNCLAATHLEFNPVAKNEEAGLIIRGNDLNHYEIGVSDRSGNKVVFFRSVLQGSTVDSVCRQIPDGHVLLKAYATEYDYMLGYQVHGQPEYILGQGLTKNLSSEVIGGFTGTYLGLFATGNGQENTNPADFDWFDYVNDPVYSPQLPYLGTPVQLPGIIEAENYDLDISGISYWDSDSGNTGGQYRNDDVDIETLYDNAAGFGIAWTEEGEWLEYTVDVAEGTMDVEIRVASAYSGGQIAIMLDGETIGTFAVTNTGGWQNWQTLVLTNVALKAGSNKILRLQIISGGVNINWIKFSHHNVNGISGNNNKNVMYLLDQNYPNPFHPFTTITYYLPKPEHVVLKIYNMLGEEIQTLVEEYQEQGYHSIEWNPKGISAGTYFYRLQSREYSETKKMVLKN